jgi:hypothetical protein
MGLKGREKERYDRELQSKFLNERLYAPVLELKKRDMQEREGGRERERERESKSNCNFKSIKAF